mmetsp:Transcript_10054/g.19817  ORF Transcript_10054/g.19817 Transcript_10054/m.19817 type:complete len:207 (+) Transcript_10054:19-639(+)
MANLNYPYLLENLQAAAANLEEIPYSPFCNALSEFANTFNFLGAALSFAASDIIEKADIIRKNFARRPDIPGLQTYVLTEVSEGTERKKSKNPSTARTLLRMMWFLDFLVSFSKMFANQPTRKLSELVREAYDDALAPHHPWAVRTASRLGIRTVPNRQNFILKLFGEALSDSQLAEMFLRLAEVVQPLKDVLWQFYVDYNLTALP